MKFQSSQLRLVASSCVWWFSIFRKMFNTPQIQDRTYFWTFSKNDQTKSLQWSIMFLNSIWGYWTHFWYYFHVSSTFRLPTARKSHENSKNGCFPVILPIRAFIGQNCQKRNNDCIRLIKGHLAWENDKNVEKEQNSGHIHFLGVWGRGKKRNSHILKCVK